MKPNLRFLIIFVAAVALSARAQLPSEGDWPATTISQDLTVDLTGDVNITGTISVTNGATLLIRNTGDKTVTMSISSLGLGLRQQSATLNSGVSRLFYVSDENCTLDIEGNARGRIVIDGGAVNTWSDEGDSYMLTSGFGAVSLGQEAIRSHGTLTLRYVTVQNVSSANGAIYVSDQNAENKNCLVGITTLDNVVMQLNRVRGTSDSAKKGACVHVTHGRNVVKDPEASALIVTDSEFIQNWGCGGALRTTGTTRCSMHVTNCLFDRNYSWQYGGAIFWNAHGLESCILTVDGCKFLKNMSKVLGGAVSIEANVQFINNQSVFRENRTLGYGGGICVWGYSLVGTNHLVDLTYYINKYVYLDNNRAMDGGGLAFVFTKRTEYASKSKFTLQIKDAVIKNNVADYRGGGIYFENTSGNDTYEFDIDLYAGTIDNNSANTGGGIYALSTTINNTSNENRYVVISNNNATDGGGGGIYLKNGKLQLNGGSIIDNKCVRQTEGQTSNGGGIRLDTSSISLENVYITGNSCDDMGGGIFAYYSPDGERGESDFYTGSISGNSAGLAGGGVCVYGYNHVDLMGVSVRNNTSTDGGGIFVRGIDDDHKATMNYSAGLVTGNKAVSSSVDYATAYQKTIYDVAGVGGGLYMGHYSSLTFSIEGKAFGIYDNLADVGADDIFATGLHTKVWIPHVDDMNLVDIDIDQAPSRAAVRKNVRRNLFWVEDYITNDINYDKGTKMKGEAWDSDPTNQRYRQVRDLEVSGRAYHVSAGREFEDYLSLTIASSSIIILEKAGMEDGENAIFHIYRGNSAEAREDYYMSVTMSDLDREADGNMRKYVSLEDGVWTIVESPWSWAYEGDQIVRSMRVTLLTPENERVLDFTNRLIDDVPAHSESIKVNNMKISTTTATRRKKK